MNRIFLIFFILVVFGIFTIILISNQDKSNMKTININATPTVSLPDTKKSNEPITLPTGINDAKKTEPISVSPTITPTPSATAVGPVQKATSATIKTSKGDIVLSLYPDDAPNTVSNFVKKAQSGFYNDLTFHRVEDWVIQGGDPLGNGTGGGNMATELNSKPFVVGSLGVARGGDIKISNNTQFFITKKDSQFLNNQYTNFGIVTRGMDVVNKIEIGDKILGITTE